MDKGMGYIVGRDDLEGLFQPVTSNSVISAEALKGSSPSLHAWSSLLTAASVQIHALSSSSLFL